MKILCCLLIALTLPVQAQQPNESIDRLWDSMGGEEAWNAIRFLTFSFDVDNAEGIAMSRTHYWDKWEGRSRVEGTDREGNDYVVIVDLDTRFGSAWVNGEPQSGDALAQWLERGYGQWVNDTYWLIAPWKLRDPGVNVEWEGEEEIDGDLFDKLQLSFDQVGLTPGDQYWLWVDRGSGALDKWAYVLEGQEPPAREWKWSNWRELGGVRFATSRTRSGSESSLQLRNIGVFHTLPASLFAGLVAPKATTIRTRAIARDAKIIGSGVGGAEITITDDQGNIISRGLQTGETGSTDLIIRQPLPRDGTVFNTPEAAHYETTIMLDGPTWLTVSAHGPLSYPKADTRASKRLLVLPGEHISNEGVILELHGFIVEIVNLDQTNDSIEITARIRMTCGCPTEPGGLWDSDEIEIIAQLLSGEKVIGETTAVFSGETSHFTATLELAEKATSVRVIASQPGEANSGMVERSIR